MWTIRVCSLSASRPAEIQKNLSTTYGGTGIRYANSVSV